MGVGRLVYHTNKESLPPQAKDFLPKLRKITVIGAESITTTLSLGPCHEPTPEDVSFEETDEKFTVFFSRTGNTLGKSIDMHICRELSRLLDVEMMMLFMCISENAADVRRLFDFLHIGEIPPDNDVDGTWLQAMLHPSEPVVPVPVAVVVPANGRPPSPKSPPSPPISPPSPSALSVNDAKQFPPLGTRGPKTPRQRTSTQSSFHSPVNGPGHGRHRSAQSSVGVSEHSQFLQRSRSPFNAAQQGQQPLMPVAVPMGPTMGANNNTRDMSRLAAQAQAFLNGNQMVPGTPGNPVWPPFGNFNVPPTGTDETDLVGVMGEHYVRAVFSRTSHAPMESTDMISAYRCTRCSTGCWSTLGRTIGRASCDTVFPVLRRSAGRPMRTLRMRIRADSSRASGLAPKRLPCGMVAGRGTTLR